MIHLNFELKKDFEEDDYIYHLKCAKKKVALINGNSNIKIEHRERIVNKQFNGLIGLFIKYVVLKSNQRIGYLEVFKNNENNYLNIYTSP